MKTTRAFTLLELLVVVAIIVILAALLAPGLSRARRGCYRAACLNNERALATVWLMYIADHNERLPSNGIVDPPNPARRLWIQGALFNVENAVNPALLTDPKYALFGDYLPTAKTYVCPADSSTVLTMGMQVPKVRSYALNAYLGWTGQLDFRLSPAYRRYSRESELAPKSPASIFLFQDVYPQSICWPYFGVRMTEDSFFNFPSSSHDSGGMVSFVDGHVDRHRWQDPRTVAAISADYHLHD